MAGVRTSVLACVGIVAPLMAANAADLLPVSQAAAPPVEGFGGGWYLRGNIGFSNQSVGSLSHPQDATTTSFRYLDKGFDAAPLLRIGVGFRANPWLRRRHNQPFSRPGNRDHAGSGNHPDHERPSPQ